MSTISEYINDALKVFPDLTVGDITEQNILYYKKGFITKKFSIMAIGGKVRENNFEATTKKVGLFLGKVIAINPSEEDYKDILNIELKEDSKATEYLGKSSDGNTKLRVDIWMETVVQEDPDLFKVSFFLEDVERVNKDGSKVQFINDKGRTAWAVDEDSLPDFIANDNVRPAHSGEEDLYSFLRVWLGKLDFNDPDTTLILDWKKLMKGNVKELKEQIDGEFSKNVVCMATVKIKEEDGNVKEYQSVYNRGFLGDYTLKYFQLTDFDADKNRKAILAKKPKTRKNHEHFMANALGEYGCREQFSFNLLKEYDGEASIVSSDRVVKETEEDGDDY